MTKKLAVLAMLSLTSSLFAASPVKKFAVLMKARDSAFYDALIQGAQEKAAEFHYELTPVYGRNEDDVASQIEFLESEVNNYDGFVLVPNRSDAFVSVLQHLKTKNKPVVIADTALTAGQDLILTTIASDNKAGGKLAAEYFVDQIRTEKVKEKCVSLFSGNMSAKTHQDRNGAFLETLKKLRPDIKVYTYQALSNFEKAREIAAKNLNQISRCYGVFAGSDSMTLGVLEAFDKSTVRRPPVLMGYDSVPEVQRKILAGKIKASVEQSPADMGRAAMTSFHTLFEGKTVEKYQTILPRLTVQSHKLESIAPPSDNK